MKCFRFPAVMSAVLFLSAGFNTSAQADVDVIVKAAMGTKSSQLIIGNREFSPSFLTMDLSLTTAMDNYFVTIDHEFSIKDDISNYVDPVPAVPDLDGLIFSSRVDTNITFGYSFEIATVFIGVRSGETNAFFSTSNNAISTSSNGYYMGASKSYFYKGAGALSGSIAIASLSGEVSLAEPFVTSTFPSNTSPPSAIKGSALGLSLGIGWTGTIYDNTNYNIDLKSNRYNFQDDVIFGGVDLSYTENFSTLYIGITHFF